MVLTYLHMFRVLQHFYYIVRMFLCFVLAVPVHVDLIRNQGRLGLSGCPEVPVLLHGLTVASQAI